MKSNLIFSCSHCGAQYPKWQGRCLSCGNWGTIKEEIAENEQPTEPLAKPDKTINLKDLTGDKIKKTTGIGELDRVLGGGLTEGSFILLGGDPGIGKTTLAMQLAGNFNKTLYVSGEESGEQVKNRAQRLQINLDNLQFLQQTNLEKIIATAKDLQPQLLMIDSIQTVASSEANGSPGSISQITTAAAKLMEMAKQNNLTTIIIGHVTKDGLVAGPKTLEHLVDTVMYLENDNRQHYKILKTVKNRFGATGEIGIFEMTETGLKEMKDPSGLFYEQTDVNQPAGICASMILEGSRAFLMEIQTLITKTFFGYPVRKAGGFDANRLQMLLAVIAKYSKINLSGHDVYVNVAGGLKIKDTGADLGVITAILSSYLEIPFQNNPIAIGEVGLSGEIRSVGQIDKRIKEAKRLGFKKFIVPASVAGTDPELIGLKNILQLVDIIKNEAMKKDG